MTIVHLIGTGDFAGTERMVVTICQGQVQRGHQVAVVLRQRGRIEEFLRREGIEILGPRIGPMSAPWHVARECRRRGVNVLHSHLTSGTHVANAVSLLTGIPVVDHLHVYNRDISHVIASRFGRLIAVSQHTKEYYESRRYMKRSSIDVVPNASPILSEQDAGMQPATARRVVAEELRLPIDTPFITLAARVTEQKGQDIFVQAAEKVLMARPDTHFLIAGSVEDAAFVTSLKDDIMARGIGGNVHILGFRTDVARLLRASVMAV
ncbi:MAG: glycosyltransferase, partial [Chthonomonas sp.]|nr:glycosyltransferase [Chthonomonas sp.]